jgi:hypothetical protein
MCLCEGLGLDAVRHGWKRTLLIAFKLFVECQKEEHLKDPEVNQRNEPCTKFSPCAQNGCKVENSLCFLFGKIKNLWEILSGQHRTNAGDEFVNGVKANEAEWSAAWGKLCAQSFTTRCHRDWPSS